MSTDVPKIFVFGSNLAGIHGAGAAYHAFRRHGAIYGQGIGRQGDSYAIPTKDEYLKSLPLDAIKKHVDVFLEYASKRPKDLFLVTAIGTGLAGYKHTDMAPMFYGAPENCELPLAWNQLIDSLGEQLNSRL